MIPKADTGFRMGSCATEETQHLGPFRAAGAMERAFMPDMLARVMQLVCSAGPRSRYCRRAVCHRYRYCVPPRDPDDESLFYCPHDEYDAWERRADAAATIARRLMKAAEAGYAARGEPSPFAPPAADPLDLTKPLDVAALLAEQPEE
jgi:hypothetical protein